MPYPAYSVLVKSQAELFRVLADEERLRIICLLRAEPEGACVCELVDALRMPQYQVSRQLGVLRSAGLVEGERQGTWVYYKLPSELPRLARTVLEELRRTLNSGSCLEDMARFSERLKWRSAGLCVVGYDRGVPFRETIAVTDVSTLKEAGNSK